MWCIGNSLLTRFKAIPGTPGGDYNIQRARPNPDGRLFRPVTARARYLAYAPDHDTTHPGADDATKPSVFTLRVFLSALWRPVELWIPRSPFLL